ncbi:MAG: CHAT domain-containing protein [Thermodesulfobacteriota bacterium]
MTVIQKKIPTTRRQGRRAAALFFLIFLLAGCGGVSVRDFTLSSLAQKKEHHEIIGILQPDVDRGAEVSTFQLFLLAGAYYEIRDYDKMAAAVDLMEKKIRGGDDHYLTLDIGVYPHTLRGLAALDQGEYDRAVKAAAAAYAYLNRPAGKGNPSYDTQLIEIAGIQGVAHANLGQIQESQRAVDRLYAVNTTGQIYGPEKFIAIARIYMAQKQYDKALAAVQNPEARVEGFVTVFYDQTFQELPKFFILTKSLYETGKLKEAKEGYEQLLKHPQIKQIGGMYWPVLLDRARIARQEGDAAAAEGFLREAVDVIEKQRASINTEAGRIGYVGDKQAVYQELISLLIDQGRPAEAFEYVERSKGRALVDLLASQKGFAVHTAEAAGVRKTLADIAQAEKQLGVVNDAGSGPKGSTTRGISVDLKKDLAAKAPELAALVTVTGAPVREIQERLLPDETLVEYYACERDWFAFVLSRGDIRVLKLGTFDIETAVKEFRAALTDPASPDHLRYAGDLYQKLFKPISGLLKTERLIIVPHGALHYLPFGALSSGREYLVERAKLRVLPTASVLKYLKTRSNKKDFRMLIMANPNLGDPRYDLKYAQAEALAIAKLMPQTNVLLRDDAKPSVLIETAGQYRMIHLAAHGIFDPDNPLGSALLLSRSGGDDGLLKAGSLYQLSLDADLVTLSACETALGKITKGDDVVGFTRGFLYAGSSAIVSTLWKVDDRATMDLMVAFYKKLLTMPKDEALQAAQLEAKKRYPHPFYWASFQLTGNAK